MGRLGVALVLGNCRSEKRSREEFCLVYSLAWGLGVSMRTFSGLMTLFASTQVGMSGLVYKLQTAYCSSAKYFLSRPVWSLWVQAWVSSSLSQKQRKEEEKKDDTCAKYHPMKKTISAIHSHVSPWAPQFVSSTSNVMTPQSFRQENPSQIILATGSSHPKTKQRGLDSTEM